jgi:hypothetical protein
MSLEKAAFESIAAGNAWPIVDRFTSVDLFSTRAAELVSNFVSECEKTTVNPTYSHFELWMALNGSPYQENPLAFHHERYSSYPWS